jgi:hypothetical protein
MLPNPESELHVPNSTVALAASRRRLNLTAMGVVGALLAAAGTSAFGALPTQWNLRVVARVAQNGAVGGLPSDAVFLQSGVPNDPAIDSSGSVAIRYTYNGTINPRDRYFVYDAPSNTTSSILEFPSNQLYASGLDFRAGKLAVLYQGLISSGSASLYQPDGTLAGALGSGASEQVTSGINFLRLNNQGVAAYVATGLTPAGSTTTKLITESNVGGVRTQTTLASAAFPGDYSFLYKPAINDAGQVATKVWYRAGGYAVERFAQGQPTAQVFRLADFVGRFDTLADAVAINNANQVAFTARRSDNFQWELRRATSGAGDLIASPAQGFSNSTWSLYMPRITPQGMVAFRAESTTQGPGLFVGDGSGIQAVAVGGRTVANPTGGTLTLGFGTGTNAQVVVGNFSMNDAGQIAFLSRFTDGTYGLIVADPTFPGPTACNPADIADNASNPGPDGLVDNGDFSLFIASFFNANCSGAIPCNPADIADNASNPGPDGSVDNGDFSLFIATFFTSNCP